MDIYGYMVKNMQIIYSAIFSAKRLENTKHHYLENMYIPVVYVSIAFPILRSSMFLRP